MEVWLKQEVSFPPLYSLQQGSCIDNPVKHFDWNQGHFIKWSSCRQEED
jgi:hypothetical protein